ncbi:MAG: CAP domain-containing protein [Solirubrobacterales bacterium]
MGRRALTVLIAAMLCGLACSAAAPTAGAACADEDLTWSETNSTQLNSAVICLVNAERTSRGLAALKQESRLGLAAFAHSADMALKNYFDHTGLDGTKFSARITQAGYPWIAAGENIAAGQKTPRTVMKAWMASTGHCHNILSPDYTDIGVGVATGPSTYGIYWTQDFGRTGGKAAASDAAAGCPFSNLAAAAPGSGGGTTDACQTADSAGDVKIDSLRGATGGKVRIAGRTTADGCCPKVSFTLKRGSHTKTSSKAICGAKFVIKLSAPKARGSVRVTATIKLSGSVARRTIKL